MLLSKGERVALNLLKPDTDIKVLVNSKILAEFKGFYHFEMCLESLSKKFKEFLELEQELLKTNVFTKQGNIKNEFTQCYNTTRFYRQANRKVS